MTAHIRMGALTAIAVAVVLLPLRASAVSVASECMTTRPAAVEEAGRFTPRPPADLPLGHWAYPLLERLVARRLLALDLTTLPVSRASVAAAVVSAVGRDGTRVPDTATEREAWAISVLAAEFLRGELEAPSLSVVGEDAVLGLGLLLGSEMRFASTDGGEGERDPSADVSYELWGGVGDDLGFYADSTILLEGQDGPRVERLSSRARTWRGVAVASERAYLKYERGVLEVTAGRRGTAWGRSRGGGLLISGSAPTLDGLEARVRVGPLSFQALHALLERVSPDGVPSSDGLARDQVFVAAHRAVFSSTWGSVGVAEAVVYSGGTPDPAYLNPLLPYYVSQHNERADDNVLWSLDFVGRPLAGLETWGEFVVDDLQYERDTGSPDKYGATVGVRYCGTAAARDYELTGEYTNVRKWTYTHDVVEHRFTHDDRPLGFELGPDADRATVELAYHASSRWAVFAAYSFSREGEGDVMAFFEEGDDDEPTFPSGDVLKSHRTGVSLEYEDPGRIRAVVGGAFVRRRSDALDEDSYELWARVQFRI